MEQLLLQILNEEAQTPYPDSTNSILAAYIMGDLDFKKISHMVKVNKRFWFYNDEPKARKIIRDLSQDRATLLPRLGRFCRILRHIGGEKRLFSFIATMGKNIGPIDELYAAGDISAEDLIADVLKTLPEYWATDPKTMGFDTFLHLFNHMYKTRPDAYENLAKDKTQPGCSLFASTYLYATNPTKYAKYEDNIIVQGGQLLNAKKAVAAIESAQAEPYFKNVPYFKKLGHYSKKHVGSKEEKFAVDAFYMAYAFFPAPPVLLDLLNYLLIYCEKASAFNSSERARTQILGLSDNNRFEALLPSVHKGTCPKAQFLSYFAGQNTGTTEPYLEKLKELAYANEAQTIQAAKMTDLPGNAILLSPFWEKGQLLDKLQDYEKKIIRTLNTDNEDLLSYFQGNTQSLPKSVPSLAANDYVLANIAAHMVSSSKLPARLAAYAVSFKQWNLFLGRLLVNINSRYGSAAASSFVDGIDATTQDIVSDLMDASLYMYNNTEKNLLLQEVARLTKDKTEILEKAFANASADARVAILAMAYKQQPDYNPDWPINALGDNSKKVRDIAIEILASKTELKPQIEALAGSKKKNQRESAEKLLMAYNAESSATDGSFDALAYVIQNIPAKAAKTIEWTGFETLPKVRNQGTESLADDRVITAYIYSMVSQNEMALPRPAIMIRETLNKDDLRALGNQLYHVWKGQGAVAKHRAVLALAAIDGDDNFVRELTKDIQAWAEASRGALAAEAVRALALQGGSLALMTVDSFSKKFKNKQVKRVAEEAFIFAAQQLGVDPEVLGDRIVPTLGFDSQGQQIIDYGNRSFTATITPDLQISLKNDQNKAIKSLPAVGSNDDKEKATAAKAAFATMKKNLKSVTTLQCLRLEQALSSNRTWAKPAWNQLFVENPIMNMYAIGLVWGTYDPTGSLITSFRYMEDGSFVTVDEEDAELPEDAQIGLCHPLDLGEEPTLQWKQQLEDYEITQPIDQLTRKVFQTPQDKKATTVTEFGGAVVYAISLLGKLQKMGWYKGSVQDAGGYHHFYKEDNRLKIGVLLDFSGSWIGADHSEEVTIYDAVFYKAGTMNYGSYIYDDVKEEDRIPLHQVPARFYSEVCYDIERAVANRIDTIADWVKNR